MSGLMNQRRPDQKFYRHPRFDVPHGDQNSIKNSEEKVKSGDKEYLKGTEAFSSDSYPNRDPKWKKYPGGSHVRGFTRSAKQGHPRMTTHKTFINSSKPTVSAAETNTCATPTTIPQSHTSMPMGSTRNDSSIGKHGGLIHLPKDVDIHQVINEPKSSLSKQNRRVPMGGNKPVVVVRPSFPQRQRYSESEFIDHVRSGNEQRPTESYPDIHFPSLQSKTSSSVSTGLNQAHWNDAAKAAYEYFLKSFSQLEAQYHTSEMEFPDQTGFGPTKPFTSAQQGSSGVSVFPQAPNEKIASIMQQIVQLDNTLSALLIPPGLCARVLPCVDPSPPLLESGKDWSEGDLLLVRWWSAIQQLRGRLFDLFKQVIIADLDFCNTAHVEQGMWKSVFYTVLELLRSWIHNPDATKLPSTGRSNDAHSNPKDSSIASLLHRICLTDVIMSGETQLINLLERIQHINRIRLDHILIDDRTPPETRSRTRRLVYLSAQKLMLFLGDLARYKELLTGERNFGKARSWYQKAQLLVPKNGRSYNQLAVLAVYTSRHLDAIYYYMRTLAASNPFPTASQSLSALFNEIRPRAENLIRQILRPKTERSDTQHKVFHTTPNRFQRVEIWVHPIDGQTTVLQGMRRLVFASSELSASSAASHPKSAVDSSVTGAAAADNEEEEDEEAHAELEEYANMSLIELSKQFGLTFIHAHGKLYTKIGMETFPEVASLALQAFSGLLAQKPCPLTSERLCQLCIVNMYNVDRAASLTKSSETNANADRQIKLEPICRLSGADTLRSVHHDHAARFALDMFGLLCRRTAQLLQELPPADAPSWWLATDARLLLTALRLWSEWMILHPEHWLPSPNNRDPTLRPCLDDWQLVAELCTCASIWLNRNTHRPHYEEVTPTTSMLIADNENAIHSGDPESDAQSSCPFQSTFLSEESVCAGFKPMLDLVPKTYRYRDSWSPEVVADFVRIDKIVLFGDFLCGIDSPILNYDIERSVYESVVDREASERREDKLSKPQSSTVNEEVDDIPDNKIPPKSTIHHDALPTEPSADILKLQRQRAMLQKQLEEEARLAAWRENAIRQASSGGRRAVEIEVRPIYLLPDTNCYIDWLEGIATLAQRSSNYTLLVPILVVNELDTLVLHGSGGKSGAKSGQLCEEDNGVTRTGLIQERARAAINYLEHEFAHRNSRLRALTARGSILETIGYRNEISGRAPGQVNDDVILACCNHFCKENPDRFSLQSSDQNVTGEFPNQPMRIHRDIVLLTSDRNLRLKALNINIPARPLRTFVNWTRLPHITHLPTSASEPTLSTRTTEFPKPQPRGQWRQPLKH